MFVENIILTVCFFSTQLSIDLADDEELMGLMIKAGFKVVFVGIETPHEASLCECSKYHNVGRDLVENVRKIQSFGFEVQGGFILGFDNDPPSIFNRLIKFIQESSIVTAMVGLLNAPKGSKLYKRLASERRIIRRTSGDNTDLSLNFMPKMDWRELLEGYKRVLFTIYSPNHYYDRLKEFLKSFSPPRLRPIYFRIDQILAFIRSMWHLGISGEERLHYWRLFFWSLFKEVHPNTFPSLIKGRLIWDFSLPCEGPIRRHSNRLLSMWVLICCGASRSPVRKVRVLIVFRATSSIKS